MESLAVIPARGGSKRVPRKNLADLGGKPLVLWTVEAALGSRLTTVVVSTEDEQITEVCSLPAVEIRSRPPELAEDNVWSAPVVMDAFDYWRDMRGEYSGSDFIMLLHPTSPFRTSKDIDCALTVAEIWTRQHHDGSVISFMDDDLNGAIYVMRVEAFRRCGSFFHGPILPYQMQMPDGLDIDTPDDLERARELVR